MTNDTLYYRYDMLQANEIVSTKSKQFIYDVNFGFSESFHVFKIFEIKND